MQEMLKRRHEVEAEGPVNLMASSSSTKENSGGGGGGAVDDGTKKGDSSEVEGHPYDFHVSGPRNLSSPNWKDLIRSSWRDPNYKRMVIACFIQAVYLLELDRQEKRTEENGLAPKWWKPFKYKVTKTLIDDRDGSIYGAILEWDRYAALSEFIVVRPSGAPRAVLALRGTILKSPTIRRDLQDDLRFLAWESLKGSIRFSGALAALRSAVDQFGSSNVCIGGHSLGAGFALQIGKALATEGVFVECHLFNPPSVSLAMSLKNIGEMAGSLWSRVRAALPLRGTKGVIAEKNTEAGAVKIQCTEISKWVPHLYVNNSDYICCYYSDPSQADAAGHGGGLAKGAVDGGVAATAKLFVMSNGPKKFLEAHGLQQWWSDDMELKLALNHSNLINRQLRSLYASPVAAAKMRSKQGKTVEWTTKDLLKGLEEFVPIYETRPIKNNMYGMGFDHSFGLWFMVRWLKPDLMIESGAFKGHSTWVLRQAMPNKPIISLSPRHLEKYLKKEPAYVDRNCTYFAGKNFVDFGSVEWDNVLKKQGISDISRVLVFFDDHQSELKRLKQALKAGFRHLIFEDNYDTGTGDHYSLRQICDQFYIRGGGHSCFRDNDEARVRRKRKMSWEKAVDIDELCGEGDAWWGVRGSMRDDFNHSNKAITLAEHFQNSRFVESVLDVYWELPPVVGPSLTHQTRFDPARVSDLIVEDGRFGLFRRLGLSKLETSMFNGYTQMVYVQISTPDS